MASEYRIRADRVLFHPSCVKGGNSSLHALSEHSTRNHSDTVAKRNRCHSPLDLEHPIAPCARNHRKMSHRVAVILGPIRVTVRSQLTVSVCLTSGGSKPLNVRAEIPDPINRQRQSLRDHAGNLNSRPAPFRAPNRPMPVPKSNPSQRPPLPNRRSVALGAFPALG